MKIKKNNYLLLITALMNISCGIGLKETQEDHPNCNNEIPKTIERIAAESNEYRTKILNGEYKTINNAISETNKLLLSMQSVKSKYGNATCTETSIFGSNKISISKDVINPQLKSLKNFKKSLEEINNKNFQSFCKSEDKNSVEDFVEFLNDMKSQESMYYSPFYNEIPDQSEVDSLTKSFKEKITSKLQHYKSKFNDNNYSCSYFYLDEKGRINYNPIDFQKLNKSFPNIKRAIYETSRQIIKKSLYFEISESETKVSLNEVQKVYARDLTLVKAFAKKTSTFIIDTGLTPSIGYESFYLSIPNAYGKESIKVFSIDLNDRKVVSLNINITNRGNALIAHLSNPKNNRYLLVKVVNKNSIDTNTIIYHSAITKESELKTLKIPTFEYRRDSLFMGHENDDYTVKEVNSNNTVFKTSLEGNRLIKAHLVSDAKKLVLFLSTNSSSFDLNIIKICTRMTKQSNESKCETIKTDLNTIIHDLITIKDNGRILLLSDGSKNIVIDLINDKVSLEIDFPHRNHTLGFINQTTLSILDDQNCKLGFYELMQSYDLKQTKEFDISSHGDSTCLNVLKITEDAIIASYDGKLLEKKLDQIDNEQHILLADSYKYDLNFQDSYYIIGEDYSSNNRSKLGVYNYQHQKLFNLGRKNSRVISKDFKSHFLLHCNDDQKEFEIIYLKTGTSMGQSKNLYKSVCLNPRFYSYEAKEAKIYKVGSSYILYNDFREFLGIINLKNQDSKIFIGYPMSNWNFFLHNKKLRVVIPIKRKMDDDLFFLQFIDESSILKDRKMDQSLD